LGLVAAKPHWIAVSGSSLVDMLMWGGSANRQGLLINDILQLSSLCRCSLLFACIFRLLKFALFLPAAPPRPSPVGKYPPPQFFFTDFSVWRCRMVAAHRVSMLHGSTFPYWHLPPSSSFGVEINSNIPVQI